LKRISIILLIGVLAAVTFFTSCGRSGKSLNERVTLWRKDKIPYGSFYAYEQLPYVFPDAEILIDKESPERKNNIFQVKKNSELDLKLEEHKGRTVNIIVTTRMLPSTREWEAIMSQVYQGNQVFISSFVFSNEVLDSLDLKVSDASFAGDDSLTVSVEDPMQPGRKSFTYPGKAYDGFFSSVDEEFASVLGRNEKGKPNFVRITYSGGGAIYIHLAPMALTNFFLLHKDNKRYYDYALSYLPKETELVVWGEYFRNHTNGDNNGGNSTSRAFGWMMKQPPLAWAMLLLLGLFLLIFIFGSKRKQRPIPERKPLRNTSLEFVKTIGRLYFQRRDNKNLTDKMTAHFMDHVRSRYNMTTSRMDAEFEKKLSFKTGIEYAIIQNVVYQAKYLSDQPDVSDAELMHYNQLLQNFYKQA